MGYPYGKTYLEKIQERPEECERIRNAYYLLKRKWLAEHPEEDDICMSLKDQFAVLGEAVAFASFEVGDVSDTYHFMFDVLDELFTSNEERKRWEEVNEKMEAK